MSVGIWVMHLRGVQLWEVEHVDGGGKGGHLLGSREGEGTGAGGTVVVLVPS